MSTRPFGLLLLLAACDGAKVSLDTGTEKDTDPDPVDTIPPTVSLTAPAEGATVGDPVSFAATASDDVAVASVTFVVDGVAVGEATSEPWSLDWDPTGIANGPYVVSAVASDAAGNEASATASVTIEHEAGLDPASITILTPADGATLCGAFTVEAALDLAVEEVAFTLDGVAMGTDPSEPYTWDWDTTESTNGSHTLRATATAADGRSAQQSIVVEVANTSADCNSLPSIQFTAPQPSGYGAGMVDVAAVAADDGGVLRVLFFVDSALLAEDTSVPHGVTWNTDDFAEGPHTLAAIAYDTTEQAVETRLTFTVDRTPPTVALIGPADGDALSGTVTVTAEAEDETGLAGVTLMVDGVDVETRTEPPFAWDLDTTLVAWGEHTLSVVAVDRAGNTVFDTIDVTVDNPPAVRFDSPVDGDTVSGVVVVDLTASDDEALSGVRVYLDGALFSDTPRAPFTFAWDTCDLLPATHTLSAEAMDASGNVSTASVTVDKDQALSVELGEVENDPESTPTAYVLDDEEVVSVVFDLDGTVIDTVTDASGSGGLRGGECDTLAYSGTSWSSLGVSTGTYVLGATATNIAGDTATTTLSITLDADADGDGYDATAWGGEDCDDADATINPAADELPTGTCDGVDDDCDGRVDEDLDLDGDGAFADAACTGVYDCDDTDATVYTDAPETCGDGIDQDCATGALDCGGTGGIAAVDAPAKLVGEDAEDWFGEGVAVGDVNDDGWPDLIVSADAEDDGGTDAGAVYFFFGPTFTDTDASLAGAKWIGEQADDSVRTLDVGDFDGDGASDLMVGAHAEDTGGSAAGAVYLLSGPVATGGDLAAADAKVYGEDASDYAGLGIAAGDVDGDGLDDMLVGAYQDDSGGSNAGAAYVVYGPMTGSLDLSGADAKIIGELTNDYAGYRLVAGDLDGDGDEDLVVSAPGDDTGALSAGAVYVLLDAPSGTVDLSTADAKLQGEDRSDAVGSAVAIGDLDHDGTLDVVVGARERDDGGTTAGAAYVLYSPLTGTRDLSTADAYLRGVDLGDEAGSAFGVADYDGDGGDDLAVGAFGEGTAGEGAGAVYVLFGPLSGTMVLSAADASVYGEVAGDYLGLTLAFSDVDLDGDGDLLVGGARNDAGGTDAGAAYLFLGGPGE
ncbi:MAG: Ig-like domain-containing protein [Pseudomonadota bacterium]|nr:Ig-like domain-containing protein [Pseudomonadota bacterium]